MSFQPGNEKHQNLFRYIIESFSLDGLASRETLGIKGSFFVFSDNQLVFSLNLDESIWKTDHYFQEAFDEPENENRIAVAIQTETEDNSTCKNSSFK